MTVTASATQAKDGGGRPPGRDFERASGRRRSTSATSSSRTTRRTTATTSFLAPATARTKKIWDTLNELFVEERKKGVLDVSQIPSSITAHAPGYIDRENEIIVGLQTDAPLKRAIMPNGGFRMVLNALKTYGYEPDPHVVEAFTKYRKTHNEAVFDAYTADIRRVPQLARPHRPARRLRPRPDHRRLPPRGALRRRPADRAQAGGEARASTPAMSTDEIIRDREELSRADPRAEGTAADGRRATASTSPARRAPRARPCSGSTSATSPP